jgi:anti-sigma factor RsiW
VQAATTDDDLEFHALGPLAEADVAPVEEHLLVCAECRARLAEGDEYPVEEDQGSEGAPRRPVHTRSQRLALPRAPNARGKTHFFPQRRAPRSSGQVRGPAGTPFGTC